MADRQRLTLDYETELPAQPVEGQSFNLAARATTHLSGSVSPAAAAQAFDPQKKLDPRDLAHAIKENMRGWLRHAATEALRQLLARPGADPLEPIVDPSKVQALMHQALQPVFEAWTFQIDELRVELDITSSCVSALPDAIRQRLSSLEGEADTAAAFGPFTHVAETELDPVTDPLTSAPVRVAAWARAMFTAHPERCRQQLDPHRKMSDDALGEALLKAVGPWIEYAVKQAGYNALFQPGRQDPAILSDTHSMRQLALGLCKEQLASLGVLHADIQVHFEAADPQTASALKLSLRGMASTIGADGEEPTVVPDSSASGQPGERPSIEESVWRHQKAIMKEQPAIPKKELAKRILQSLERDGYPAEERKRVGRLLGADPDDLP